MGTRFAVAVGLVLVLSVLAMAAAEKQMILTTPHGDELRLDEDNTWVPARNTEVFFERDFTVQLTDGRYVLINTDGTWGFVTQELVYAEDLIMTTKVVGKGLSTSADVVSATQSAQKKAMESAVSNTRSALQKIKRVNQKKLRECVEAVEKDVDTQEQFARGKGWTVQVLITLDKGSLLAVTECARDSTSKPEQ